jgi:CRISPR-associated protein Cas2
MRHLSGYRIVWIMVLFDLPVMTPEERKAATGFRNYLLDEGFQMAQFSVYLRCTPSKEAASAYVRRIESAVPSDGKVDILQFTDRQYENIVCFRGKQRDSVPPKPAQLLLF